MTPTVEARPQMPEVERELRAQVERARAAGIRLSHLDSHTAARFRTPALFEVYRRLGAAYGPSASSSASRVSCW